MFGCILNDMKYDAVVIGGGPNGLSAALELARRGLGVCVLEGEETIGGGVRSAELTLPGYIHDVCSAIHPMALISPFFRSFNLDIDWIKPDTALAHALEDQPPVLLFQSLNHTAEGLAQDGTAWRQFFERFIQKQDSLFNEILKPIRIPGHPFVLAKFGLTAMRSAASVLRSKFKQERARALFAGCAAHSILSLLAKSSASFGMVMAISAHATGWPFPKGGSQQIANSMASSFKNLRGEIQTGRMVESFDDLPDARAYFFDVTPRQLIKIAGKRFPKTYTEKLQTFRYGPGVFKIDWALDGPIPWKHSECLSAGTVHLGGSAAEIVQAEQQVAEGKIAERPFVLVAQQSLFDRTRAPENKQTGWAYCHVPNGCNEDMTQRIESQVERFAPGFRDRILARHTMNPAQLQQHNANLIGGDISGGSNDFVQLMARPVFSLDPYATPDPKIFLCSSSTPPGGGVHGMCGFNAARSALKRIFHLM
jgi:phytoene dehydrogenase-like protein